jgi:hypothetical protein
LKLAAETEAPKHAPNGTSAGSLTAAAVPHCGEFRQWADAVEKSIFRRFPSNFDSK